MHVDNDVSRVVKKVRERKREKKGQSTGTHNHFSRIYASIFPLCVLYLPHQASRYMKQDAFIESETTME